MNSSLHIQCMGTVRISRHGTDLFASRKQAEFIAALVAAGPDGLTVHQLLDELYGERVPASRNQAIYQLIERLKPKMGSSITNAGGRYQLDPPAVVVDAWQFMAHAKNGQPRQAMQFASGSPYDGVFDGAPDTGPLVRAHAQSLTRMRSAAAIEIIATWTDADAELLDRVTGSLIDDPFNETLAVRSARVLYHRGEHVAALRVIQNCKAKLRNELGLDSSAALDTAELAILTHDEDALRLETTTPPVTRQRSEVPGLLRRRDALFVGRSSELRALDDAVEEMTLVGTPGAMVIIRGPAGAGKSELVAQMANDLADAGVHLLAGSGATSDFASYEPFSKAIPEILDDLHLLSSHTDQTIGRLLFWQAVSNRLQDITTTHGPTVLVLEDLHFADSPSCLLTGYLAAGALPANLLIVITTREPEPGSVWDETETKLSSRRFVSRLDLPPLELSAIEQILRLTHPNERPAVRRNFATRLLELSGGNALVVSSICQGTTDLASADLSDVEVSASQRFEGATLAKVDAHVAKVLSYAGLIGVDFGVTTLCEVMHASRPVVLDALESAMRAQLVTETDVSGGFRFEHVLIRDAFASQLSSIRQSEASALLARRPGVAPSNLIRYVRAANDELPPSEAISLLESAAGLLEDQHAFTETELALSAALEIGAHHGVSPDVKILTRLASTAACAGDLHAAAQHRTTAFDLAEATRDHDQMLRIAVSGLPLAEAANGDRDRLEMLQQIDASQLIEEAPHTLLLAQIRQAILCDEMDVAHRLFAAREPVDRTADPEAFIEMEMAGLTLDSYRREAVPVYERLSALVHSTPPGALRADLHHRILLNALLEQVPEAAEGVFDAAESDALQFGSPRARWHMDLAASMLNASGQRPSLVNPSAALNSGFRLGVQDAFEAWGCQLWLDSWMNEEWAEALALVTASGAGITDNVGWGASIALASAGIGDRDGAFAAAHTTMERLTAVPQCKWNPAAAVLLIETAALLDAPDIATAAYEVLLPRSGFAAMLTVVVNFGPIDAFLAKAIATAGLGDPLPYFDRAIEQAGNSGATVWLNRTKQERDKWNREQSLT